MYHHHNCHHVQEAGETPAHTPAPPSVVTRARVSPWPAIPMDEAFRLIEQHMPEGRRKFIPSALVKCGHILASRVVARSDQPEHHTSTKDGYAVIAADTCGTRHVVGVRCATAVAESARDGCAVVQPGECMRISTGGVVPRGADAVVMVEDTELIEHDGEEEKVVRINGKVCVGQDIRLPGSDIRRGDLLVDEMTVLSSAEIGLIASNAQGQVEVYRRPRVCVMSTGNELVDCSSEEDLTPGQVRDSNRPQLMAHFLSRGFKPIDAGIVPDTRESLVEGLRVALRFANVVVTTGGVSMGEKDLMKDVLQRDMGFKIHFGRVWMKPGLPATFATGLFEDVPCAVFALPGNPVSSWVCSELFAVPALRRMAGYLNPYQTVLRVELGSRYKLDVRPEYVRAVLQEASSNTNERPLPRANTTGSQMSCRLLSLTGANLLLRLPGKTDQVAELPEGTVVDALVVGTI